MNAKRQDETAEELMRRLEADPEWVAARDRREAELRERIAAARRLEAPLVEELRAAGHPVASVWDLVNTASKYTNALPILLAHLTRPYPPPTREGIARALAVPESRFAWSTLTKLYRDERDAQPKDGLAAAIAAAADDGVVADVIALVRDTSMGPSRLLLLSALERSRDPRAHETIREMAPDPELKFEIRAILRRLDRRRR